MKIIWVSSSGDGLAVASRLEQEGAEIHVFVHNPRFRGNFAGMLKNRLDNARELRRCVDDSDPKNTIVVFDMVRIHYGKDYDDEMNAARGVKPEKVNHASLFGAWADWLRRREFKVIGTSKWSEILELDRQHGKEVAEKLGIACPPYFVGTPEQVVKHLSGPEGEYLWVMKPDDNEHIDMTYIEREPGEILAKLQTDWASRIETAEKILVERFIPGITLDEEVWWNGNEFVCLNSTVEHKRMLAGDLGQNVGSTLNLVWPKSKPLVPWGQLTGSLKETGYIGPLNATLQVSMADQRFYFLEWTPRFGYDAIFCLLTMVRFGIKDWIERGFGPSYLDREFVASARVSLPPYPSESENELRQLAQGTPIRVVNPSCVWLMDVQEGFHGLQCAGSDGIVGVVTGRGETPEVATNQLNANLRKVVRVSGDIQYRSDAELLVQDFRQLAHHHTR